MDDIKKFGSGDTIYLNGSNYTATIITSSVGNESTGEGSIASISRGIFYVKGNFVTASAGGGAGTNTDVNATNGSANTGGGGGGYGGLASGYKGGNGGSGVVIIKYPDTRTITVGAGLTSSTSTSGGFKVTTFTAGTGSVSFS